jgi:hypothetical protein
MFFAALTAQVSDADSGKPAPRTIHYAKWRVVPFELRRGMSIRISSTAT